MSVFMTTSRLKVSIHLKRPLPNLTQKKKKNDLQDPLVFGVFPFRSLINFVAFRRMLLSKNFPVLSNYVLRDGVFKLKESSGVFPQLESGEFFSIHGQTVDNLRFCRSQGTLTMAQLCW